MLAFSVYPVVPGPLSNHILLSTPLLDLTEVCFLIVFIIVCCCETKYVLQPVWETGFPEWSKDWDNIDNYEDFNPEVSRTVRQWILMSVTIKKVIKFFKTLLFVHSIKTYRLLKTLTLKCMIELDKLLTIILEASTALLMSPYTLGRLIPLQQFCKVVIVRLSTAVREDKEIMIEDFVEYWTLVSTLSVYEGSLIKLISLRTGHLEQQLIKEYKSAEAFWQKDLSYKKTYCQLIKLVYIKFNKKPLFYLKGMLRVKALFSYNLGCGRLFCEWWSTSHTWKTFLNLNSYKRISEKTFFDFIIRSWEKPAYNQITYKLSVAANLYKTIRLFTPIALSAVLSLILLDYFQLTFLRQLSIWVTVGLLVFWLFSGFNFFLKRYMFGKYTSAIQRFWKRTNAYFWLLEGFLFIIFFYYYLNSSQEPLYMFDESNLNQTQCFNLLTAFESYMLLCGLIGYTMYLQLHTSTSVFSQSSLHLLLLTAGLLSLLLIETYQFYYITTKFNELNWAYSEAEKLWTQEVEVNRIRVKHQYLMIAALVKYWHFIFIFFSWVFTLSKSGERKKLTHTLLGLMSQNLYILFILNLFFYLNWVKWVIRRLYDSYYYWFFVNPNNTVFETGLSECLLLILNWCV